MIAYHNVINKLTRLGALHLTEARRWRSELSLSDLYEFNNEELALLRDLADNDGEQVTRSHDKRFSSLREKGAVDLWANDRYHVKLTKRGRDLLDSAQEMIIA